MTHPEPPKSTTGEVIRPDKAKKKQFIGRCPDCGKAPMYECSQGLLKWIEIETHDCPYQKVK
jgi:predicted RNA-binding Zn-ribbon protein involved in translation (DUF1610 family)